MGGGNTKPASNAASPEKKSTPPVPSKSFTPERGQISNAPAQPPVELAPPNSKVKVPPVPPTISNSVLTPQQEKLFEAVKRGNLLEVQNLVEQGGQSLSVATSYDLIYYEGELENVVTKFDLVSPIHIAAERGYSEIISFILKKNPNLRVDTPCVSKSTTFKVAPIHLACYNGRLDAVKLLLDHGSSPDVPDSDPKASVILFGCSVFLGTEGSYSEIKTNSSSNTK
jgi:hypothetical protein